jgi:hypothetical protein
MRMHGTLVALPSGIMFGLFWAVKQFHSYCLFFSLGGAGGVKVAKNRQKTAAPLAPAAPDQGAWRRRSSRFNRPF